LYSRNVENLFMAGRDISVTHDALGAVRVMRTCGMMGEAVGKAAYLCVRHDTTPRGVYRHHLQMFRQLLDQPGSLRRSSPSGVLVGPDLELASIRGAVPATARFGDPNYNIWCGSVISDHRGKYHMFYSRWPSELGHLAWVTHSEIAHAESDSPIGPWRHRDVVLPERGPDYWDGHCTHNPTIIYADKRYYLYYMGNRGDRVLGKSLNWSHRNNQRIGVAWSDSPAGPWHRADRPLIDVTAGFYDALCCNNPSVTRRPDGSYLMVYKGVGNKGQLPFGGPVVHLVATSASPLGPFTKETDPVFHVPGQMFVAEDPFIWRGADRYWAIVKDNHGFFTHAGYSLALFQSGDGVKWEMARQPLVTTPEMTLAETGEKIHLDALERPQVLLLGDRPAVLYCAAALKPGRDHSMNVGIPLGEL
jgi:hypothetical protein